jgi:D-alanyl-D-alanine carboxypeptidase/D-alanyl-D-alanine-endopeptidase (penicillin-binding protein 4)
VRRILVLCALLAALAGPARASDRLAAALEAALGARALRGAHLGVLVVDAADGRVLFARAPDRPLVPASNLKILTAVAVLDAFGPAHRFTTRVLADAPPDAAGAVERLYLRGGGDPALTSESFWRLAADLRLLGLAQVRGGIVVDDSAFDDERWHPSWGQVGSRAYHAPVGALTANYGAFTVEVTPGSRAGEALRVRLDPPVDYLRVVNRARTGARGSRATLAVERVAVGDVEEVRVSGELPAGGTSRRFYRSVADPGRYAGSVARLQLEANGVAVGPALARSTPPAGAVELLAFEGEPLGSIVRSFVKYSNNGIAETLLKALGAAHEGGRGGWASGARALTERLAAFGLDPGALRLVDGSGLSTRNRLTPRALVTALLRARASFAIGPEFVAALPIAARDGTLQKRADASGPRVRAKTGLLEGVTGLSGYAELADGREAVFSILVNGYRSADEEAMAAVDAFVAALVSRGAEASVVGREARRAWRP